MQTIKKLQLAIGGLSQPTKMPGFAYGIPAVECKIGSILRKQAGSVCSKCYARKGMYSFPCVRIAQERRLQIVRENLSTWKENMVELLRRVYAKKTRHNRVFRWHDSGDIQSVEHFAAIVEIAARLPKIRFWLPTKEYATIREWMRTNSLPENLTVRVSAPMIGQTVTPIPGTVSSTVATGQGFTCGAPKRGGKCGPCRACWDKSVLSVDYAKH